METKNVKNRTTEKEQNTTSTLLALAVIFMTAPAVAGLMLYGHTFLLCVGTGEWKYGPIDFNVYNEWWFEFILCVGGFIVAIILYFIALYKYSKKTRN